MGVYRINKTRLAELVDKTIKKVVEADLTNITSIGNYAFIRTTLEKITIPASVTSIGNYAFGNCTSLTSITIPENITSIGSGTFNGCTNLTEMILMPSTPPALTNTNAISTATTIIKVPSVSVNDYKTATNWSNFASIIVGY